MRDAKFDMLTHLHLLREQMPEGDERIVVIEDLIRARTHRDSGPDAAQSSSADSCPTVEIIPVKALSGSDISLVPAANYALRPSAMQRFPSHDVVYIAAPAKSRGFAAVCGLVGTIAIVTAVLVLGIVGLASHPQSQTIASPSRAVVTAKTR